MRSDVNKLDDRVATIEKEPQSEYKEIKKQVRNTTINIILGAVIGAIIALLSK